MISKSIIYLVNMKLPEGFSGSTTEPAENLLHF